MLAYLHQYEREEVDFDDNRTAGESQTEEAVDKGPEEYFGDDLDIDADTWETVEYDGDPIQRRHVEIDEVTAVSVPEEPAPDDDLPGRSVQVRMEGGIEQFEHARVVEVEDPDP